ncbi:type IV toxin-antitoxin system AbiEi family antitoxin [Vibrio mimicus]|uniref:type IV toxin-antitoxin system AbiEi family antitoxin n=1 Tax=Vibrio mimicus TaxID=674 RepID=UPI0001BAC829|nr:type IV toxin-antitoxin system AbiEi family antitoxin [Vibrio mimicus]EEY39499.1 hypothetical protein VII_003266 [Vibrio mimicus MB451]
MRGHISEWIKQLPDDLNATVVQWDDGSQSGVLSLQLDGMEHNFKCQFKLIHRKESLVSFQQSVGLDTVLLCEALSDFLVAQSKALNLNFIDLKGNTRIVRKGCYILIQSPPEVPIQLPVSASMTPGVVRCVFALYAESSLLQSTYQHIAEKSGVSLGMVAKTMTYLKTNQYLSNTKSNRRLLNLDQLLYEWLLGYKRCIVEKSQRIRLPTPKRWEDIPVTPDATWGGEVSACQLTEYLIPQELLLFSETAPKNYPIAPDNVMTFLWSKPFWGKTLVLSEQAKALLATGDLIASHDGRNREVAALLNEKYLNIKTLPL